MNDIISKGDPRYALLETSYRQSGGLARQFDHAGQTYQVIRDGDDVSFTVVPTKSQWDHYGSDAGGRAISGGRDVFS